MEKRYDVCGLPITVAFDIGHVGIKNDRFLKQAVDRDPKGSIATLVRLVKADYPTYAGCELAIGDDSFAVEIWGHLYAEYFLLKYSRLLRFAFPFGLYARFLRSCEIIDCGERGKDPNRWVWDRLARHYGHMAKWTVRVVLWRPEPKPQERNGPRGGRHRR